MPAVRGLGTAAAPEAVFRGVVVVRGDAPRTRGEPLELTLPASPEAPLDPGSELDPDLAPDREGDDEQAGGRN